MTQQTNPKHTLPRLATLLAAIGALTMSGCAQLPTSAPEQSTAAAEQPAAAETPEQAVSARSLARADAIIKKDAKAQYAFMTPAYRSRASLERFEVSHPSIFVLYDASIYSVHCASADSCDVKAKWTYRTPGKYDVGKITNVIPEQWIKVDGQWYFYTKE